MIIDMSDFTRKSLESLTRALPASYYDEIFESSQKYLDPAKDSPYKVVWDKVLEKLPPKCSILDIGCGPGQFATLCIKAKHLYVGADFSEVAIKRGRKIVPKATFHLVDIIKDKSLLTKGDYDVVTLIEFLEHVEEDLGVLSSIPEGKKVVLTVPKYWSDSHVRVFKTPINAHIRYGKFIDIESLDTITFGETWDRRPEPGGHFVRDQWVIYVLSGTRRDK